MELDVPILLKHRDAPSNVKLSKNMVDVFPKRTSCHFTQRIAGLCHRFRLFQALGYSNQNIK